VKGRGYNPAGFTAFVQTTAGVGAHGGLSRANPKLAPSMARPNLFSGD